MSRDSGNASNKVTPRAGTQTFSTCKKKKKHVESLYGIGIMESRCAMNQCTDKLEENSCPFFSGHNEAACEKVQWKIEEVHNEVANLLT